MVALAKYVEQRPRCKSPPVFSDEFTLRTGLGSRAVKCRGLPRGCTALPGGVPMRFLRRVLRIQGVSWRMTRPQRASFIRGNKPASPSLSLRRDPGALLVLYS